MGRWVRGRQGGREEEREGREGGREEERKGREGRRKTGKEKSGSR